MRKCWAALFLLSTMPAIGWGRKPPPRPSPPASENINAPSSIKLNSCRVQRVTDLPGSHQFASDFIEAIATDPAPRATDRNAIWALTADLSDEVTPRKQAMYISKSSNGGATWRLVARIDSRYFDAHIGEGLRNGFIVAPGGKYFIITTQRGAFQVFPQPGLQPIVTRIPGPRVPYSTPKIPIPKHPGDPVRANVVRMTADGKHLLIGYGYFDLDPQIFRYRKDRHGSWIPDGRLPRIPTEMDLLSMQFDNPQKPRPDRLYVGTGDQAYLLDLHSMEWRRIEGVGDDSAIHAMSVVGGLHLAACWGIYNPTGPASVARVTNASFLLHPHKDEVGSNLRAYGIEVDPYDLRREIVTSITGVYTSRDSGATWRRVNELPEEEFRTSHFNRNGTILVSGITGTFLINPYSAACVPRLEIRGQ